MAACAFVNFKKNNSFHLGIKQTPFEVMFGRKAKLGLASSSLPKDIAQRLNTQEDLENALNSSEFVGGTNEIIDGHEDSTEDSTEKKVTTCQEAQSDKGNENPSPQTKDCEDANTAGIIIELMEAQKLVTVDLEHNTSTMNIEDIPVVTENFEVISEIKENIVKNQILAVDRLHEQAKRVKMDS